MAGKQEPYFCLHIRWSGRRGGSEREFKRRPEESKGIEEGCYKKTELIMNVLIVEPPFYILEDNATATASLGLGFLAAAVQAAGHKVMVYAPDLCMTSVIQEERFQGVVATRTNVQEKMVKVNSRLRGLLAEFKPDVVGISLWTGRFDLGREMAKCVKKCCREMVVVAGGVHATICPEETLRSGVFDYVVCGEGERAFPGLLNAIGERRGTCSVPNISYIDSSDGFIRNSVEYIENLDTLSFPAYETFVGCEQLGKNTFNSLMMSRGCPFGCSFCASHLLWTRRTRYHSPAYIVELIKHLNSRYGVDTFRFNDDTFTLRKDLVHEFCERMSREALPVRFHCDTRVECVTSEMLGIMKRVGLESIAMGVESGDEEMRRVIGKSSTLEATKEAFSLAREAGIGTVGYFMVGFPGERYEQALRTLNYIRELRPDHPCIGVCIPYPGTKCYSDAIEIGSFPENGLTNSELFYHHTNFNYSGVMSNKEWNDILRKSEKIRKQFIYRKKLRRLSLAGLLTRYSEEPRKIMKDVASAVRYFGPP